MVTTVMNKSTGEKSWRIGMKNTALKPRTGKSATEVDRELEELSAGLLSEKSSTKADLERYERLLSARIDRLASGPSMSSLRDRKRRWAFSE